MRYALYLNYQNNLTTSENKMHLKLKNGEKLHFPSMDSLLEYSESKKVMKQDFQILDLLEQEPKACVKFKYKGFTISASKILFGMIVVFDVFDNIVFQGDTIEQVIDKINSDKP